MRFFLEAGLRVVRGLEQEDSPTISSSTVIQALDELTFDHVLNDMRSKQLLKYCWGFSNDNRHLCSTQSP